MPDQVARPARLPWPTRVALVAGVVLVMALLPLPGPTTKAQDAGVLWWQGWAGAERTVTASPGRVVVATWVLDCPAAGMYAIEAGYHTRLLAGSSALTRVEQVDNYVGRLPFGSDPGQRILALRVAGGTVGVTPELTCATGGSQLPG